MIAGVDFGTKQVHIVRRPPGGEDPRYRRIALNVDPIYSEPDALAARELGREILADPGFWDGVWLCGVEYPFVGSFNSGMKTMLGALMATIPPTVHVMPLPADLWTKWFLRENRRDPLPKIPRKSAERKPLIKARALQLLGSGDLFPQDAYDAYGISVVVEMINEESMGGIPSRPGPTAKRAA